MEILMRACGGNRPGRKRHTFSNLAAWWRFSRTPCGGLQLGRDRVASVEKRADGKWRARYRPVPGGRQIARHFSRKIDAERWLTEQQSRVNRGDWTAPNWAGSRSTSGPRLGWPRRRP